MPVKALQVANRATCSDVWIEWARAFMIEVSPKNECVAISKDTSDNVSVRREIRGCSTQSEPLVQIIRRLGHAPCD
jgi:hypothetical protein